MSNAKEQAKAKKKQAKEQVKAAKKQAKAEEKTPQVIPAAAPATPPPTSDGLSPAERSAQAAEKQVRLQRLRVWFAFVTVLLTLAALLITTKPWTWLDKESSATEQPAAVDTENP